MTNFATWVLVAGEQDAAICSSEDGNSRLLRVIRQNRNSLPACDDTRRAFAWQLMMELFWGAHVGSFDGVIIIAAKEMLGELRRVALPEIRKRLVAEIPGALPAEFGKLTGLSNDMLARSALS